VAGLLESANRWMPPPPLGIIACDRGFLYTGLSFGPCSQPGIEAPASDPLGTAAWKVDPHRQQVIRLTAL